MPALHDASDVARKQARGEDNREDNDNDNA
jgi:hypothetical protein